MTPDKWLSQVDIHNPDVRRVREPLDLPESDEFRGSLCVDAEDLDVHQHLFAGIEQLLGAQELCAIRRLPDVLVSPANDLDRGDDGRRDILFPHLFDSRSDLAMARMGVGHRVRIEEVHHFRSDSGRRRLA
jgi:hypothetical protein